MTQPEVVNNSQAAQADIIDEQNAQIVNHQFKSIDDTIFSGLLSQSAKFWVQNGTSGGCLILGSASAILAISATIFSAPRWKPEDLVTILCFASVLIVLGAVAGIVFRSIETRRSEERVQLYGMVKEAIVELHKADVKALTDAGKDAAHVDPLDGKLKIGP